MAEISGVVKGEEKDYSVIIKVTSVFYQTGYLLHLFLCRCSLQTTTRDIKLNTSSDNF